MVWVPGAATGGVKCKADTVLCKACNLRPGLQTVRRALWYDSQYWETKGPVQLQMLFLHINKISRKLSHKKKLHLIWRNLHEKDDYFDISESARYGSCSTTFFSSFFFTMDRFLLDSIVCLLVRLDKYSYVCNFNRQCTWSAVDDPLNIKTWSNIHLKSTHNLPHYNI